MDVDSIAEVKPLFKEGLYKWREENLRPLPWKETEDPYLIWLSEVILQQTRVEQGKAYYFNFKNQFPTIQDLAEAEEEEVLKCWQGLGYYSRARNMHQAAKFIAFERGGVFPKEMNDLLQLKGVGPYTAAAIASFAYNQPYAVLDGNVFRVLARFFGITEPINSTKGKKIFSKIALLLLDKENPAYYNQAIMDFGALTCKSPKPDCQSCRLSDLCSARRRDDVRSFPVKTRKIQKRTRYFHYLVISDSENLILRKRIDKDIWQNLYDFPLIEKENFQEDWIPDLKAIPNLPDTLFVEGKSRPYRQLLTHQEIRAVFWRIKSKTPLNKFKHPLQIVGVDSLKNYPFPKIVDWYLAEKSLDLLFK